MGYGRTRAVASAAPGDPIELDGRHIFARDSHNSITLQLLVDFKRAPGERLTMAQLKTAWNLANLLDARL